MRWLSANASRPADPIGGFLEKLDAFDLDDFIRAIRFDEMKLPIAPPQLPTRKFYYGLDEMMAAEIDCLKATVLSKSTENVMIFSDMPLEEMAADEEFPKKWMYGMALMLKKGLHLDMIHNTVRPLPEMMLGLEGWIPMYMTGQVSPYYYEDLYTGVFHHHLKVSGTVALSGEAIAGHHDEGRYLLTKNREEVRYFRRRAERMLEKARPLMRILGCDAAAELDGVYEASADQPGARRLVMSTLPIGTIPEELLKNICDRAQVEGDERERICAFAQRRRDQFKRLMSHSSARLEVPVLSADEFAVHPAPLDLSGMFYAGELAYTFEEYAWHLKSLRTWAGAQPNLELVEDAGAPFRNIQISVQQGVRAIVSKNTGPQIHFIIEHPAMVAALEQFNAPVVDR